MRLFPTAILFSLLGTYQVLAQNSSNPPCIKDCVSKNLVSSQCDGDETGAALDRCECATFRGATRMLTCVKACPTAEQAVFAGGLPELCREALLPGVTPATGSGSKPSGTGGAGTATSGTTPQKTNAAGASGGEPGFVSVVGLLAAALFL